MVSKISVAIIGGYFVTDEREMARRYALRQKGLELKRHLATLQGELKEHAEAWRELADSFRDSEYNTFKVESDAIRVLRPKLDDSSSMNVIVLQPKDYFPQSLQTLLTDLEQTKQSLTETRKQCADMGDPLP